MLHFLTNLDWSELSQLNRRSLVGVRIERSFLGKRLPVMSHSGFGWVRRGEVRYDERPEGTTDALYLIGLC